MPATRDGQAVAAANVTPPQPTPTGTLPTEPGVTSTPTPPAEVASASPAPSEGAAAPPTDAAAPPADATAAPATATAAKPKPIGAYLGNNDLLLKLDPVAGVWVRLPPRSAFMGGEQLLALPAFRTHVVLADVNAYLTDGTQVNLRAPAATGGEGELGLQIPYGRVVLNSGLNGNRLELSLVDEDRVVQLGPSSSLAIEVKRIFEPGGALTAPREPAPTAVTWYLTSGTASWGDGKSAEGPATWTTTAGEDTAPAAIDAIPEWVDREPISDNQRRARERVAEALVPGEPVNTPLLELSDPSDRRPRTEDRALAALCGAYVGQYDPLVRALGDVNQRASWKAQIEALRASIARDPSAVEGIHRAFAMERGEEAANDLTEMVLGFDNVAVGTTREEVKQGALVRLLRWMEDDDLTHRVLASYNVNEITGTNNLGGYRPERTAAQRKRDMQHYWTRLEDGELMPRR
jgi:hypothetical protein